MHIENYAKLGKTMANAWGLERKEGENAYDIIKGLSEERRMICLLAASVIAQSDTLNAIEGLRRAIDRLPAKQEKQQLAEQVKLAKEERKAAEARERAAIAEFDAKFSEPPVMYQCDHLTLDAISRDEIRNRF